VNWDPENHFKGIPLKTGIIERRLMQKKIEVDKDFAEAMKGAVNDLEKEAVLRREMRKCVKVAAAAECSVSSPREAFQHSLCVDPGVCRKPTNEEEMMEYFLDTTAEDLEFEVVRFRPQLTEAFFK
jgi:hypothetical protein